MIPGQTVPVNNAHVTCTMLNHPVINFGYRVEHNGKSVFFTGDHEPPYNIYEPEDEQYHEYQMIVDEKEREIVAAMQGVDVLIARLLLHGDGVPGEKRLGAWLVRYQHTHGARGQSEKNWYVPTTSPRAATTSWKRYSPKYSAATRTSRAILRSCCPEKASK